MTVKRLRHFPDMTIKIKPDFDQNIDMSVVNNGFSQRWEFVVQKVVKLVGRFRYG